MTTLTLRYIKGDFVVTGPEIEPTRSRRAKRPRTGVGRTTRARPSKKSVRSTGPPQRGATSGEARGRGGLGALTILKCTTHIRPTALMRGETEWSK
jgi:hypothetical protein